MNPYIEILRPTNAVMASVAVLLMAIVDHTYTLGILVGAVTVFIATGAGNIINDYYDHNIDKTNKPERPIPSGRISKSNALYYSLSLFVIAVLLGFSISLANAIVVIVCDIIMILYAYDLKQRCLIGNITVGLLTALTFIFGGLITHDLPSSIILAVFAFLMTLSREIIKDTEDVEGDLKENASTFPIVYGKIASVRLAFIINIITCILSPVLYLIGLFSIYYMIIVLVADVLFIYYGIVALKNQDSNTLHNVSKNMKIAMFIAFISFVIGSIL